MIKEYGLACLIVIIILIIGVFICKSCDGIKYNNGICKCGGHYEYQQAVGHRLGTTYIYRCDKCGDIIELTDYINER